MTQRILLINWFIAPAIGIWIWSENGFFIAISFVIIWLIADKIWDWLTEHLITGTARVGANEEEAFEIVNSGEIPKRMAFMMIVDLIGTVTLPWILAVLFLVYI